MKLRLVFFVAVFGSTCSFTSAQQNAQRPVGVDDLFGVREVHDAQISSDGQWIAYTVDSTSLERRQGTRTHLDDPRCRGRGVALTTEDENSAHPRWSPDGKSLAFLSSRKDSDGDDGKTRCTC